jgi:hypothetical protein
MTIKTVNHVLIDFCQRSPEVEHLKDAPTTICAFLERLEEHSMITIYRSEPQ